jgi:tRNA pseudouridine55 synthase
MATGVLPMALGRATRLLPYLPSDKAYRAVIRFGLTTTTDDIEGEILTQQAAADLSLAQVEPLLPQFLGQIEQIPPSYSAIQVDGKRLYDLARSGKEVQAPSRTVEVYSIDVLDWRSGDFPELEVAIACGAGTYIRAIARDLGAALGIGGTLASLVRTHSSGFSLETSLSVEALTHQVETGTLEFIAPAIALQHLPDLTLESDTAKRWCQGQKPSCEAAVAQHKIYRIHDQTGQFLGISEVQAIESGFQLRPKMVFAPI